MGFINYILTTSAILSIVNVTLKGKRRNRPFWLASKSYFFFFLHPTLYFWRCPPGISGQGIPLQFWLTFSRLGLAFWFFFDLILIFCLPVMEFKSAQDQQKCFKCSKRSIWERVRDLSWQIRYLFATIPLLKYHSDLGDLIK